MTIIVNEINLAVQISLNLPNLEAATYSWILTSQYSKQPEPLSATLIDTNDRYSTFIVTFPTGFGDEHKNGVYYWDMTQDAVSIEKGLAKIITEPGGTLGTVSYDSNPDTENRVAEVYYRPNY